MSYSSEVLADSPLVYYRLGEASGTVATDSSGNGRNGTYVSSPTLGVTGALTGDSDKAMTVAGGSRVDQAAAGWMAVGTWSVEAWVKPSTIAAGTVAIAARHSATDNLNWDLLRVGSDVQWRAKNVGVATTYTVTAPGVLSTSAWTHLVGTYDGANLRLHVNGVQVGGDVAMTNPINPISGPVLTVGALSANYASVPFSGSIDEFAYYGTALSGARVAAHYSAGTTAGGTTVTGGQATESDTAQGGTTTVDTVVSGGQAAESDTAQGGTVHEGSTVTGGQAVETDTPQAGATTVDTVITGGQATETDTARPGAAEGGEPPLVTDTTNDAHKLVLGGWGVASWEPAIVHAPVVIPRVRQAVISAIAYGPVTMQGTQPVFTYSEADRPRLRQRILLGGRDYTYDRDVPVPDVEYELADLLLYGPGTLSLPQYVAFVETGTEVADRWAEGRRVKVQLVDDFTDPDHPTIEATIYKGFVLNPHVSGRHLDLELGGEAQGRLTLRNSHVLFKNVHDVSRLLWREFADVGVRYLPRLGEPGLGIRTLNFDGMSKMEKVQELLARAIKKDGTQRAVLPDVDGAYRPIDKDTETIHFSVFVDDAFTVAEVSSDITEKPNSIYPTAIDPNGMRIDGAAVPGLISTPAPEYPMDDDSSFTIGATDEDTDSGDGISIMVNRLGAVGLLDIRDTPGGFDEDAADALNVLMKRARLTGPLDTMTPDLWRALWDLDKTGSSPNWSSIQPRAQDPSVQRYKRSASGAPIGLNPDFDEDAIQVDESPDMGTGIRERQVDNWSETRVHAPGNKVWYGTITVNLGAVLAGQVDIGATLTPEMLRDARLVKPGLHNLWVPNFDNGTLFGVSGAQVNGEAVVFTVDTRFRPALEVWERLQVRRETRRDPSRRWMGDRQSTRRKDAVRGFISWGGVIDRNVPVVEGWNMVEVVVGDYGTLAKIRTVVQDADGTGHEYALALFGKPDPGKGGMTTKLLNDLVPAPLAEDGGDRPWRRKATRKTLNAHGFLTAWGTFEEPCGYDGDLKNDGAPLTGVETDDAGVRFVGEDGYLCRLFVWVSESTTLRGGRIMWPLLEGGV